MRVLFAVSSWGLGHATRDLVLLRALLSARRSVTVLSTGRALRALRQELGDRCDYLDLPDIPVALSRTSLGFHLKMLVSLPRTFHTFWREHRFVRDLCRREKYDRIVSDSRYGVWSSSIPSYHVMHTLHHVLPGRALPGEYVMERVHHRLLSGARKILVPDDEEDGLAGDLCHNLACFRREQLEYIGILSSVVLQPCEEDVDCFVSISGVEPQRTLLEQEVLRQARELAGRVVIALGKPEHNQPVSVDGRMTIYPYMGRQQQAEMLNRARVIVSRSGYTTLMELAELGKRALVIPAVGQTEQEYLGEVHEARGNLHSVPQRKLDLPRDTAAARGYRGLHRVGCTARTASRFMEILEG